MYYDYQIEWGDIASSGGVSLLAKKKKDQLLVKPGRERKNGGHLNEIIGLLLC